jgi:hypothetical protein
MRSLLWTGTLASSLDWEASPSTRAARYSITPCKPGLTRQMGWLPADADDGAKEVAVPGPVQRLPGLPAQGAATRGLPRAIQGEQLLLI